VDLPHYDILRKCDRNIITESEMIEIFDNNPNRTPRVRTKKIKSGVESIYLRETITHASDDKMSKSKLTYKPAGNYGLNKSDAENFNIFFV
jgi:hypothetical protein